MTETKNTNYQSVGEGALASEDVLQNNTHQTVGDGDTRERGRPDSPTHEPFFIVPSKVFEYELNPYELSVLFYLLMRADNKTHTCYPSEKGIARACGMGKTSACKSIKSLNTKGIIEIKKQYQPIKNGKNRQTSNNYQIMIFNDISPYRHANFTDEKTDESCIINSPHDTPHIVSETPPYHETIPPISPHDREINKTKPNRTKTNMTISTELSMADAEAVIKERNNFLDLKRDCFEKLKNDFEIEEDYVLLIDRALEHLWSKKEIKYEDQKYSASELKSLLIEKLGASSLASCVEYLRHSSASIRSPVPYLAKCILGALTQRETPLPSATAGRENEGGNKNMSAFGEAKNSSSFDVDDFFQAALERAYNYEF